MLPGEAKKELAVSPQYRGSLRDRWPGGGVGGGVAGTQLRAQGSELVGGACFCSPAPGDISLPQLLSH